eukprot:UN05604
MDICSGEYKWIQCDFCAKWRKIPSKVTAREIENQSNSKGEWSRFQNIWDLDHNNCNIASEINVPPIIPVPGNENIEEEYQIINEQHIPDVNTTTSPIIKMSRKNNPEYDR